MEENKLIKQVVAFGMGYVAGKHNLKLKKKEINKVIKEFKKEFVK